MKDTNIKQISVYDLDLRSDERIDLLEMALEDMVSDYADLAWSGQCPFKMTEDEKVQKFNDSIRFNIGRLQDDD